MFSKRFRSLWIISIVVLFSLFFTSTLDAGNRPRISITDIELSRKIVEFPLSGNSWSIRPWEKNIGHLEATSGIDGSGNIVLAGHSTLPNGKPGIFYHLDDLQIGASISIFDGSVERHYSVTELRVVSAFDLSVALPTPDDRLTLITCALDSYDENTQTYTQRLAVIAQRVG